MGGFLTKRSHTTSSRDLLLETVGQDVEQTIVRSPECRWLGGLEKQFYEGARYELTKVVN